MIADYMLVYTDPVWFAFIGAKFILALWFLRHLEFRSERPTVVWGTGIVTFALLVGVQLLHVPKFAYDFALSAAVLAAYAFASRRVNGGQAAYIACVFVACFELGKIVWVDLAMQPLFDVLVALPSLAITLVWSAGTLALTFGFLVLVSHWMFRWPIAYLSWGQVALALFPLVPYIYIRSSDYMFDLTNHKLYWDMVLVTVFLGATTLAVVIANAQSMAAQAKKVELAQMTTLLKEQHMHYTAQKRTDDALRRYHHDLKHHLTELQALSALDDTGREEEIRRLGRRLQTELDSYERAVKTGNETLDIVLAQKRGICQEKGVRAVFYADARHLSFLPSFALCAIFGNILDNAIEATEHLPESEEREIHLDIRRVNDMVAIQCRNPYVGTLVRNGDGFVSTKTPSDRVGPTDMGDMGGGSSFEFGEHGVGLKSVRSIVAEYGGFMDIDAGTGSGGTFVVTITLPIPRDGDGR